MTLLYPAQWRGRRAVEAESPEGWDSASVFSALSRKCQIRAFAAKRGLPPIPAFGIGWLYPVCLRLNTPPVARPIFIPSDEASPHNVTLPVSPSGPPRGYNISSRQ